MKSMNLEFTSIFLGIILFSTSIAFGDLQEDEDIFYVKGENALRAGYIEKALSYYDKALELNPNHIESMFKKGGILLIQNKTSEAIIQFDKVLEIDPNHVDALSFKADELVKMEKIQEAKPLYEHILEIEKDHVGALSFAADELVKIGKTDDAVQLYEKILQTVPRGTDPFGITYADKFLKITPNNPNALNYKGNSLVLLERSSEGNTVIIGNKLDEAISYFDRALEIEPEHVEALFNKGRALIQKARVSGDDVNDIKVDTGLSFIERVLEINPNHVGALNFRADELVRFEKIEEAIPIIDKVLEIEPENTEALFLKGRTFLIDRNWNDAVTYFDKVLRITPGNKIAQTNFQLATVALGMIPIDGYLDVKVRDSEGRLVSNILVENLYVLNHTLGISLLDNWPVTQQVTRNENQFEVLQYEQNSTVNLQYVWGGASHYGFRYPYEPDSWLLRGNFWQYYVDKGDLVTFVYTVFRPLA